jgi:hypothetical protein
MKENQLHNLSAFDKTSNSKFGNRSKTIVSYLNGFRDYYNSNRIPDFLFDPDKRMFDMK